MKTLSILQPWASLVALGHKKIETRSWNTKYRGELLIHASLGSKHIQKFMNDNYDFMNNGVYIQWMDKVLPHGAIIGKVNLIDTISTNKLMLPETDTVIHLFDDEETPIFEYNLTEQELAFGDYSPNRFGWLLSDPVLFDEPIPCKGKLGLWEFDLSTVMTDMEIFVLNNPIKP